MTRAPADQEKNSRSVTEKTCSIPSPLEKGGKYDLSEQGDFCKESNLPLTPSFLKREDFCF